MVATKVYFLRPRVSATRVHEIGMVHPSNWKECLQSMLGSHIPVYSLQQYASTKDILHLLPPASSNKVSSRGSLGPDKSQLVTCEVGCWLLEHLHAAWSKKQGDHTLTFGSVVLCSAGSCGCHSCCRWQKLEASNDISPHSCAVHVLTQIYICYNH